MFKRLKARLTGAIAPEESRKESSQGSHNEALDKTNHTMEDAMTEEQEINQAAEAADPTSSDTSSESAAASAGGDGSSEGLSPALQIRDRIIAVLKTVYDPEIPVDIYELGLVYGVEVTDDGEAHVTMTLTTPMCPVAETLPPEVEDKVRNVMGVKDCSLDLVWDPPWSVDMMSDAARLDLNMM